MGCPTYKYYIIHTVCTTYFLYFLFVSVGSITKTCFINFISGCRHNVDENCALLGYYAVSCGNYHTVSRNILEERRSHVSDSSSLFLVLEIRIWCYIPENKSIASTLAMVTEVKDNFSGKILSVLSYNISTANICSRDEGPLQQATDLRLLPQVRKQSLFQF